jgi:hypothetical protein
MKIIERNLPASHNVYLTSDKHYGTILQHKHGIKKFIDMVKNDPIGYWCDLGDLSEGITVDDPRYCHLTTNPEENTTLLQYEAYVKDHLPIADKCLVILEGNHDWKLGAKVGSFVRHNVCARLGEEIGVLAENLYGTYSCVLAIHNKKGKLLYKMFLHHGPAMGSINSSADDPLRREANMMLSLKRKLRELAGDCIIMAMGHTHKLLVKPPISRLYLTYENGKSKQHYTKSEQTQKFIPEDDRWYVNDGCFYKLHEMGKSGYAERAGYAPNELGFIKVKVENGIIKDVEKIII